MQQRYAKYESYRMYTEEGINMEVKVIFYHVFHEINPKVYPETIEFVSNVDDNTTIKEVLDKVGQPCADLSEYYYLSGMFCFNQNFLPYIINSKGKVEWDISFEEAKVIDFISTHAIENNIIYSKTGYPQAGGPGFKELTEIWESIYPIIDQFVTVVGLGTIIIGASKWLQSLFKRKDVPPQSYFDLVYSRNEWNHNEFAELLDISREDAKHLLKLFGYEYDKYKMMFVQQSISLQLREKLSKINILDI